MSTIEIVTLFVIMAALAALPSASVALVITRSATLGVANGVSATAGIILGDLVFILLAIFGLSIVAETMGSLFMVIKYLGATYLLWLGYTLITSKSTTTITVGKTVKNKNLVTSFIAGFILTLGDVKAIIFYASLLPLFLNLSTLQTSDVLILISVMVVSLGSVKILYAYSAVKVVAFAKDKKLGNAAKKTAGGFLLGAGGYLIVKA
jgi:threonine/homoserine/homoserine lactone efflux protein